MLPNVQVDGTLNVEGDGEIFIPAGATLSKVVELEGNQTIAGVKTFSSSPIVPTPTTGTQGANKNYVDTKQSKAEVAYNANSSSYVPNTLSSGAIIERGSNANGEYVKFADGTLICNHETIVDYTCSAATGSIFSVPSGSAVNLTLPATFVSPPRLVLGCTKTGGGSVPWNTQATFPTTTTTGQMWLQASVNAAAGTYKYLAIGRWK